MPMWGTFTTSVSSTKPVSRRKNVGRSFVTTTMGDDEDPCRYGKSYGELNPVR
jgi:hypothetical protein